MEEKFINSCQNILECFYTSMIDSGVKLGLPQDVVELLTKQTIYGSACLSLTSEEDISTLRRQVTSPNGTTQVAIEDLINNGFMDLVKNEITKHKNLDRNTKM